MSQVVEAQAPLLEARGLRAAYEGVEALRGVDLEVREGSVTAILGANGAGKSTLLAVLAGLVKPSGGTASFAGESVSKLSAALLARRGLCLVPEGRGVFPNLTVRENLWVMSHAGVGRRVIEERAFDRFPILANRIRQQAGTLSGGEQQMLALARAVATQPRLLLVDELSMGLAPLVVDELYRHIAELATDGVTIVVVEQFARTALSVADTGVVMAGGRILNIGPATEMDSVLADAYLGTNVGKGA
jgi:branched-chain amino acid transport system ATP-binding protein